MMSVQLSEGDGIAVLQFDLNYDSEVLSYPEGASPTSGDLIIEGALLASSAAPDRVSIAVVSASSLNPGSGTVVLIPLEVSSQAVVDTQTLLTLSNVSGSDPLGLTVALQVQEGTLTISGAENGQLHKLYFAHYGNGSESGLSILSKIVLVNLDASAAANATIAFNDDAGEPMTVLVDGMVVVGEKNVLIPGNGAVTLATDGQGVVQTGSVIVSSDVELSGTVVFGGSLGLAGVGSSEPLKKFVSPIETAPDRSIGVAMMGLAQDQALELELRDQQGNFVARASVFLAARTHIAKLVDEFAWDSPPDFANFSGTLTATGTADLAATVILVTSDELATLPVTPLE